MDDEIGRLGRFDLRELAGHDVHDLGQHERCQAVRKISSEEAFIDGALDEHPEPLAVGQQAVVGLDLAAHQLDVYWISADHWDDSFYKPVQGHRDRRFVQSGLNKDLVSGVQPCVEHGRE